MKKGRLLFVWHSAGLLGGVQNWLDTLLPALARRGWDPVLGLAEGPRYNQPEQYLEAHPFDQSVNIPCMSGTPEGRRRALITVVNHVNPDLVISINMPDTYPAVAHVRSTGKEIRTLMSVHGIEAGLFGDIQRFGSMIDAVVTPNRLTCLLAEDIGGFEGSRIHYIPCGIDLADGPVPSRRKGDVFRIGYLGRLVQRQKRVFDLPRISDSLDRRGVRYEFMIAGAGAEDKELRNRMSGASTIFLGGLKRQDLEKSFYSEIDALVITSSWETGPLVAWEAMSAGVPVVSSRFVGAGLENALRHEDTALIFDIGDTEKAAEHIARLAQCPALREGLRRRGLKLVKQRYDRTVSEELWEACFSTVLAERPKNVVAEGFEVFEEGSRGFLGRVLGPRWSERVREALKLGSPDPGGARAEWPHNYGSTMSAENLIDYARAVDQHSRDITRKR